MSVFSRWLLAAFYDFNMTNLLNALLQLSFRDNLRNWSDDYSLKGTDQITSIRFTFRISVGWVSFSVTQHFPAAVGLRCANPTYKV
jgi:hypothetical protein